MTTIEALVENVRQREAREKDLEREQEAELERIRRERDIEKVRRVASESFSQQLLSQLKPKYQPARGNFRPCMQVQMNGVLVQLNWGEFLWAEPGRQDYLEGRGADGRAVQFCPDFKDNDEKLALLIDSFKQRIWWRELLGMS